MERVKKGEKYWYVEVSVFSLYVQSCTELDDYGDSSRFDCGNYFHTKEEAEAMAKKLRAVLKGASVIEMPSEEEINHQSELYTYPPLFKAAINWLESKIVK